jgi:hypothetical protein
MRAAHAVADTTRIETGIHGHAATREAEQWRLLQGLAAKSRGAALPRARL